MFLSKKTLMQVFTKKIQNNWAISLRSHLVNELHQDLKVHMDKMLNGGGQEKQP